jgi:hypothetical protein
MSVWKERWKECDKKEAYQNKESRVNEFITPCTSITLPMIKMMVVLVVIVVVLYVLSDVALFEDII